MLFNLIALAALAAAPVSTGVQFVPLTPVKPVTIAPALPPATLAPATLAPAPRQAVIIAEPTELVLRAGTPVALVMAESITTNGKKLRVGQRLRLTVASDVRLGSQIVIPAGSQAEAEITDVRNKGMWGKSGRIEARVLNVRVGDRLVRLTGSFDDKGVTGTAGVVAAIVFVPVVGFFVTGTSANIPAGSGVRLGSGVNGASRSPRINSSQA